MKNKKWYILLVLGIVVIGLLQVFALQQGRIERYYANGLYPILCTFFTRGVSAVPFSLFEIIVGAAVLFLLILVFQGFRTWRNGLATLPRATGNLLLRFGAVACVIYLWFLVAWGLNYYRVPLEEKIGLAGREASSIQYLNAAQWTSSNISSLSQTYSYHDAEVATRHALYALNRILANAGESPPTCIPRIKRFFWNLPLDATGTRGITSPWTLEVHLSQKLFPEEIPFLAVHETAHLKGYASETEANLLAFEACLESGHPLARFSGFFHIFFYLAQAVPQEPKIAMIESWPAQVHGLRQRIQERNQAHEGPVKRASQKTYDIYLKLNKVPDGIKSYSRVGNLVALLHASGE